MTEFTSRVQALIEDAVADRDYHSIRESFSIVRDDDDGFVAKTTLTLAEPPDVFADAADFDWEANTESVSVPLPDDLSSRVEARLDAFRESVSVTDKVVIENAPHISAFDPDTGAGVILDFRIDGDGFPFTFERLAEQVTSETSVLDDPSDITYVAVDGPMYDPTESEWEFETTPDYTVLHKTDTPHERWGDCETLEDYAKMVAENNEDTTVEDVLGWDTYQCHFHINGDVEPNALVRDVTQAMLDAHITVSDDTLHVSASRLVADNQDDPTLTIRGSISCLFDDLDGAAE